MGEIIMPTELTAENGAKAALIGEFCEHVPIVCPNCVVSGESNGCEVCGGSGEVVLDVPVSWATIKKIYSAAVKLLGKTI